MILIGLQPPDLVLVPMWDSGFSMRSPRAGTQRPNSAVVLIRCEEGGPTYAEVMGESKIWNLSEDELSITNSKVRRAQTGLLLERILDLRRIS